MKDELYILDTGQKTPVDARIAAYINCAFFIFAII